MHENLYSNHTTIQSSISVFLYTEEEDKAKITLYSNQRGEQLEQLRYKTLPLALWFYMTAS